MHNDILISTVINIHNTVGMVNQLRSTIYVLYTLNNGIIQSSFCMAVIIIVLYIIREQVSHMHMHMIDISPCEV